jgi:hypothetical protein
LSTDRGNDKQHLANKPPAKVQPETKENSNSAEQLDKPADLPPSVNTGGEKQPLAGVPEPPRKRSRDTLADRINTVGPKSAEVMSTANSVSPQPSSLPESMEDRHSDSAALVKTLRVEIQTKDPKIKIIWFVQQETKPVIPSSKGT